MKKFMQFLCCLLLITPPLVSCSDDDNKPTGTPLDKPALTSKEVTQNSFVVEWNPVQYATGYAYTLNGGQEKTVKGTTVNFTDLTAGTEYTVKVKATSSDPLYTESEWTSLKVTTLGQGESEDFILEVKNLNAFSFTLGVTPKDPDMTYYASWANDEEWAAYLNEDGSLNHETVHAEAQSLAELIAMFSGSTYPEILNELLTSGTQDLEFSSSITPETHMYAYIFGWGTDGTFLTDVTFVELTTPAPKPSTATVEITYGTITVNSMQIICTPDPNVTKYYQFFTESSAIDDFYAEGGTDSELTTIVMQQGYEIEPVVDDYVWPDLSSDTEYQMTIVGLDDEGGVFMTSSREKTLARTKPDPIDSPLFDELPGEWTGTQTVTQEADDGSFVTEESTFPVTITKTAGSFNYPEWNQLACQLNGYGGLPYYDVAFLMENGWEEPEAIEDYGPKILLNINADGTVYVDGTANQIPFYAWSQAGTIFLFGANAEKDVNTTDNMVATLSDDHNTITISHSVAGYYPSMVFMSMGAWYVSIQGTTDIVLTRNAAPAAPRQVITTPADQPYMQLKADRKELVSIKRAATTDTPQRPAGYRGPKLNRR